MYSRQTLSSSGAAGQSAATPSTSSSHYPPQHNSTAFVRQSRLCAIPPRIRAFVKVIHDLDRDQFPEVFSRGEAAADGDTRSAEDRNSSSALLDRLNDSEVYALSVAVGREVRTARDWEDFSIAMEDYGRHLTGVDMATLERSGLGKLVTVSTSIDHEAMFTSLSMAKDLSSVFACHQLVLKIVQSEYVSTHPAVFNLFIAKAAEILSALEAIVISLARQKNAMQKQMRAQSARAEARAALGAELGVSPSSSGDAAAAATGSLPPSNGGEGDDDSKDMGFQIIELNSTLDYHVRHLAWFISVSNAKGLTNSGSNTATTVSSSSPATALGTLAGGGGGGSFDAREAISDISAAEVWCHHVGRYIPACSVQTFMPALAAFPSWARAPILKLLDYRGCGVVSAFSVLRVLGLWGPFLLLDKNLARDLTRGFINLSDTTAMAEARLKRCIEKARMAAATASFGNASGGGNAAVAAVVGGADASLMPPSGTTVMTVSDDKPNAFDVLLVTAKGNIKKVLIDRSGGAWVLEAVSQEDYENPTDVCVSFAHIFKHPAGERYAVPDVTSREAANSDSYSILHRACFRNNASYAAKLFERGNGVIVNSAVVDPAITHQLSWTPLMAAVNNPNGDPIEVCRMLLENGADPTYADQSTCTALYYAIVNRYVKAAATIIQFYCNRYRRERIALMAHYGDGPSLSNASPQRRLSAAVGAVDYLAPAAAAAESIEGGDSGSGGNATVSKHPPTSAVTIPLFVGLGAHFYNAADVDNRRLEDCVPDFSVVSLLLTITEDVRVARVAYKMMYHKLNGFALPLIGDILNTSPPPLRSSSSSSTSPSSTAASGFVNIPVMDFGTAQHRDLIRNVKGASDVILLSASSSASSSSPESQQSALLLPYACGSSVFSPHRYPRYAQREASWNFGNFPCPTLTDDEAAREVSAVQRHTLLCRRHATECGKVLRLLGDHCFLLSVRQLLTEVRAEIAAGK